MKMKNRKRTNQSDDFYFPIAVHMPPEKKKVTT